MRRSFTVHFVLRLVPIALFAMLMLLDFASKDPEGLPLRVCLYLLASAVIYLAYPLTRDENTVSVRFCAVCSIYYLSAFLFGNSPDLEEYLFILPSMVFTLAYLFGELSFKYKEPSTLFRKDAVWCCAEEDSRTFYALLTLTCATALMILRREEAGTEVFLSAAGVLLSLDIALHVRAYSGKTLIMDSRKERRIQTILLSSGRMTDMIPEVENAILAKAYKRVDQYMRESKPYLDEKFSLEKMSDTLRLNKVYISRAVNKYTNKNFRQYINWHRVLYSVELMRADPWLKVIELAFMSGFHSQVTYNMCFKQFMDQTPSDMVSRLRLQKPRPEVSKIEVKLPQDEVLPSSRDVSA